MVHIVPWITNSNENRNYYINSTNKSTEESFYQYLYLPYIQYEKNQSIKYEYYDTTTQTNTIKKTLKTNAQFIHGYLNDRLIKNENIPHTKYTLKDFITNAQYYQNQSI
jgi:hypothetical protein